MRMPDFLVIGAAKAGTSALTAALSRCDDVFVPRVSEPGFWAWRDDGPLRRWDTDVPASIPIRDEPAYAALFDAAGPDQRAGEASPIYLESPVACGRVPVATKIVATLRDPADRAWSAYWMHRRDGVEQRPPEQAFAAEEHRVRVGFYGRLLRPWGERFEVHVVFASEWGGEDPTARLGLAAFLGLDPEPWRAVPARANVGGVPRSAVLERVGGVIGRRLPDGLADGARALRDRVRQPLPELPEGVRAQLRELYREDSDELCRLLGRQLPW